MHIFSSNLHMVTRDGVQLMPFQRYVMPTGITQEIQDTIAPKGADYTLSHFNSYERRYSGQPLAGKKLLIYRHGAIGDTLMATALVAWLRKHNPTATIDLYCRPQNVELWHGVGCRTLPGFPSFDAAKEYDYHLLFENLMECNSEPDQGCAMDDLFAFAGIDPATVPDEAKVPVVVGREDDVWNNLGSGYIVIQANASNRNRTYPQVPALTSLLWKEFRRGIHVFGDKDENSMGDGFDHRGDVPRFRNLIPIIRNAALVICPDSSVGHLAAAFPSVPVISLWGLFDPKDRVKYYRNHHPLTAFDACPHAPCRWHGDSLPLNKCKDAANNGPALALHNRPGGPPRPGPNVPPNCAALRAITPEAIVAKAKELLT